MTVEFVDLRGGAPDPNSWRNVDKLIKHFKVEVCRNEFTGFDEIDGYELNDDRLIELLDKAHRQGLRVKRDFLLERLKAAALRNRHHPVRDYFDGLKWDKKPRLDKLLATYMGADSSQYTSAVGALTLIAAVRRIRKPGTKFDTMPILEGPQGTGKSSALKVLAGAWFTDALALTYDSKRVIEQTAGKLIVEVPELSGMRKAEIEHVKANLSRSDDRARLAYGRLTSEVPRQFVMIGTTNTDKEGKAEYLKDHTGNRRFWPVRTHDIDLAKLKADRDQLWAEAVAREAKRESITLPEDLWETAARRQERRMENNVFYDALKNEIGGYKDAKVLAEDVWHFLGKRTAASRRPEDERKVGHAMVKLGWKRKQLRHNGAPRYHYVIGEGARHLRVNLDGGMG